MDDLISRQAVLDLCDSKDPEYRVIHFKEDVECLPSVNSQEPKTGHWKRISMDKYSEHAKYWYRCDRCGKDNLGNTDWCPNCGADMRGEQDG